MIATIPPALYTTTAEFCAAPHAHADRMRATGEPEILLSEGRPEAVVMSPEMFRQLVEQAEYQESVRLARIGMEQIKAGKYRTLDEMITEAREKHGFKGSINGR